MRTTLDLPDPLYRQIKARAALEGRPVKDLVQALLLRGLASPEPAAQPAVRSAAPVLSIGQPMPLSAPSNAELYQLLDDTR